MDVLLNAVGDDALGLNVDQVKLRSPGELDDMAGPLLLISYQFTKNPASMLPQADAHEDPPFEAHVKPGAAAGKFGFPQTRQIRAFVWERPIFKAFAIGAGMLLVVDLIYL